MMYVNSAVSCPMILLQFIFFQKSSQNDYFEIYNRLSWETKKSQTHLYYLVLVLYSDEKLLPINYFVQILICSSNIENRETLPIENGTYQILKNACEHTSHLVCECVMPGVNMDTKEAFGFIAQSGSHLT